MSQPESGSLFIVSAASGTGKTSLVEALVGAVPDLVVSVSATTRAPRPGEVEGRHYRFLAPETFAALEREGGLLESARVYDHHYGTPRDWVESRLAAGTDVLLEIDWQGARQVREKRPDAVGVFILPPSLEALEERLRGRGQDADEVIARRMARARDEMSHYGEFDYLVVNDDFDEALGALEAIVRAARQRRAQQAARHGNLLAALVDCAPGER
jgi:guanylate kinase